MSQKHIKKYKRVVQRDINRIENVYLVRIQNDLEKQVVSLSFVQRLKVCSNLIFLKKLNILKAKK